MFQKYITSEITNLSLILNKCISNWILNYLKMRCILSIFVTLLAIDCSSTNRRTNYGLVDMYRVALKGCLLLIGGRYPAVNAMRVCVPQQLFTSGSNVSLTLKNAAVTDAIEQKEVNDLVDNCTHVYDNTPPADPSDIEAWYCLCLKKVIAYHGGPPHGPANHVHPEDPPNWVLDPQYTPDEQEKCQAFTPQDQLVSNDTETTHGPRPLAFKFAQFDVMLPRLSTIILCFNLKYYFKI
ncbi:uncharacterized protein LOC142353159 isoform X2 [Convolutriloba macropyga]|uniref:uncharacterized protein LOC142353159 isoform X2 n=1 Tax=Convolutriloba macropyga TaxID=536237 RepID=UPI003F520D77